MANLVMNAFKLADVRIHGVPMQRIMNVNVDANRMAESGHKFSEQKDIDAKIAELEGKLSLVEGVPLEKGQVEDAEIVGELSGR